MQNRDGWHETPGAHHAKTAVAEAAEGAGDVSEPGANYRYWREHGHEWADEYDSRKKVEPYYHLQEIMLTDYIARCAPAKVLEFGCGVGRHLRNLSKLPGIDVHGYDQSSAMVSGCLRWADKKWLEEHTAIGSPTGPLPFADGEFDVVYTAEVLLHSRPEDLETILRELLRVCRGHILHLETAESYKLIQDEHHGCWKHDLVAAYAKLGHKIEVLQPAYLAHRPFRLSLGKPGPEPAWPLPVLAVMRRAEADLCAGLSELRERAAEATDLAQRAQSEESRKLEVRIQDLQTDRDRLFAEATEKQAWIDQLESDRDRLFTEAKEKQTWIARVEADRDRSQAASEARVRELEADRDRLFAEAAEKQAWIVRVESDRDEIHAALESRIRDLEADRARIFEEARDKQAWIDRVESERDAALAAMSTARHQLEESRADVTRAEAQAQASARQETLLSAQVAGLTARLREQTDRIAAAEGTLRSFADAIRRKIGRV